MRTIKSKIVREIFRRIPLVKQSLWSREFWDGYFVNTVGKKGNEDAVRQYIEQQRQADEYKQLHCKQLTLF